MSFVIPKANKNLPKLNFENMEKIGALRLGWEEVDTRSEENRTSPKKFWHRGRKISGLSVLFCTRYDTGQRLSDLSLGWHSQDIEQNTILREETSEKKWLNVLTLEGEEDGGRDGAWRRDPRALDQLLDGGRLQGRRRRHSGTAWHWGRGWGRRGPPCQASSCLRLSSSQSLGSRESLRSQLGTDYLALVWPPVPVLCPPTQNNTKMFPVLHSITMLIISHILLPGSIF